MTSLVLFLITGEGDDYLTVSLRDGGAAVGMTLAKGRLDLHIKPTRVRFDDNQWHKISVHRKVQEVSVRTRVCACVRAWRARALYISFAIVFLLISFDALE